MNQENTGTASSQIGMWASIALALETIVFGIALLVPSLDNVAYLSSVLIAPSFVALMVAIYQTALPQRRVWGHLGLASAIIYAVYCGFCYYTQLTVVRINDLGAPPELLQMLSFTPGSFMFAQDMLGYSYLCLATLVSAPVFVGSRLANWLRGLFIVHGLVFIVPLIFPALSFAGDSSGDEIGGIANLGWCVLFCPIAVLLAVYFRRQAVPKECKEAI